MPGLKRLGIEGFRRLRKIDLEMRPLMVMIGANNVGKTSFLDAMSLLAASANGQLGKTLSDMGGIASVITRGHSDKLTLSTSTDAPDQKLLDYILQIGPIGQNFKIFLESLTQRIENKQILYFSSDGELIEKDNHSFAKKGSESVLSGAVSTSSTIEEVLWLNKWQVEQQVRQLLCSIAHYFSPHVSDRRALIRLPQQLRPSDLPGDDGGDLISLLYNLRENCQDRFEAIEDTLKVAFPGFESLGFPPVAAGMLSMIWKEKHFNKPLYMNELSSGTLRFLWLVSLLQSPGLTAATMIDEPEGSLHPELLNLLADLFREASHRTQLIVATQSDSLIRFLQPNEVVVMDIDDEGFAQAKWADTLDLDEWLKEYSLDELWHMGRIGARS